MEKTTRRRGERFSPARKRTRLDTRSYSRRPRTRKPYQKSHRPKRNVESFDVSRYINKNPVDQTVEHIYTPTHSFDDFGLTAELRAAIKAAGLTSPTQIQDEIIPLILKKQDVVGLANTGTGKTAAFLIPLIELTMHAHTRTTLILTPTRELAIQVEQELRKLSSKTKTRIFSTTCVGGANIRQQIADLRRKNHFIIGTPGRILDLINRGSLRNESITTVVLDEADRMLDMGFIRDIKKILKDIPTERETFFFSATMSPNIQTLIHDFSKNPVTISVKKQDITNNVEQDVIRYGKQDKFSVLTDLLSGPDFTRVLVFGAMKHSVERLKKQLVTSGVSAESIHGNKSHSQRQRALSQFKKSSARVLVATDVAARGIHVDNVSHVINYDLPTTYEDYVHRIGRTGRGTHRGKALTFVS
mgnify:CR=1 FL=1